MTGQHLFPVLFADDTNLIATHNDFNYLIDWVYDEFSIAKWFQMNKLTLVTHLEMQLIFCNKNKL